MSRRCARRRRCTRGLIVELRGLELFGYHGVHEAERRDGQMFLYDIELEVGDRGADDRIENAVDYSKVAAAVREVRAVGMRCSRRSQRPSRTCWSSGSRPST